MSAERQAREDIEYGRFRIELDAKLDDKDYPENNLNEIQKQAPFDTFLFYPFQIGSLPPEKFSPPCAWAFA